MLLQTPPETHENNSVIKSRSQSSDYHSLQVAVRTLHDSSVGVTLSSFGCWKTDFNQPIFHYGWGTFCGHLFFPCRGASQCFSCCALSCLILISAQIISFTTLHFRHGLQFRPLPTSRGLSGESLGSHPVLYLLPSANYSQF